MFKRTLSVSNGSLLCTGRTNCTQVFIVISIYSGLYQVNVISINE